MRSTQGYLTQRNGEQVLLIGKQTVFFDCALCVIVFSHSVCYFVIEVCYELTLLPANGLLKEDKPAVLLSNSTPNSYLLSILGARLNNPHLTTCSGFENGLATTLSKMLVRCATNVE